MLVHPTRKRGFQYFLGAQTHATQVSNKPFRALLLLSVGILVVAGILLSVCLVCCCCWRVLVAVCCFLLSSVVVGCCLLWVGV